MESNVVEIQGSSKTTPPSTMVSSNGHCKPDSVSNGHSEASSNANSGRDGEVVQPHPCRYKGVVPQTNGNWGAQIYAKQQRVWLGTFKTEMDAAMAYDSAAIRLRSGDSYRNINSSQELLALEAQFQGRYKIEEVLNMIKDGSYQQTLAEFRRACCSHQHKPNPPNPQHLMLGNRNYGCQNENNTKLFEKELTTSDVGKLNRLVIPKKYATQFLPRLRETKQRGQVEGGKEEDPETELVFLDGKMKCWKFRYCYWKSSQSFVFTRGWNKFVKGKKLQAKDSVVFYACRTREGRMFFRIEVRVRHDAATTNVALEEERVEVEQPQVEEGERRGIRLFGVDIPC